jgi:hypothetical protein
MTTETKKPGTGGVPATAVLRYGAREMNPSPLNMTLADLAWRLHDGRPVIAELEPGDATYYSLLIVPAWAGDVVRHLGRYGIAPDQAHRYLIVTKLNDQGGSAFYATADVGEWDLHGIDNPWSRELIVWWLRLLWAEIKRQRGNDG